MVANVERQIADDVAAGKINHEYLPVLGLDAFRKEAAKLVLGEDSPSLKEDR